MYDQMTGGGKTLYLTSIFMTIIGAFLFLAGAITWTAASIPGSLPYTAGVLMTLMGLDGAAAVALTYGFMMLVGAIEIGLGLWGYAETRGAGHLRAFFVTNVCLSVADVLGICWLAVFGQLSISLITGLGFVVLACAAFAVMRHGEYRKPVHYYSL